MAATQLPQQTLIDRIYDGVVDGGAWHGIAEALAAACSATSAVLKLQDAQEHVDLVDMTANLMVDAKRRDWADYWHRHDLWVEKSLSFGLSKIVTSRDLLADAELKRTDFHNDWLRRLDIFHMMGAVFPAGEGAIAILGIHRPERAGFFSQADRRQLAGLLPHLRRAFQLRRKLAQAQAAAHTLSSVLDQSTDAIVVVDGERNMVFANAHAERLLRQNTDIGAREGKLVVHRAECTSQLAQLVKQCVQTASGHASSPGGCIPLARRERLPLCLTVAPLRCLPGDADMAEKAVIFIRDPEAHSVASMRLRELFGLTPTEAAVAKALAEGLSPDQIAHDHGIGLGTVRSHLKKILQKTNTNKQSQLVSTLLRVGPDF